MRAEVCTGTFWPTNADVELHHFAYWSADVGTDAADLKDVAGRSRPARSTPPAARPSSPTSRRPATRRIELVALSRLPAYRNRVGADVPTIA